MKRLIVLSLVFVILFFTLYLLNLIAYREITINNNELNNNHNVKNTENKSYCKRLTVHTNLLIHDSLEQIIKNSLHQLDAYYFLKSRNLSLLKNPQIFKEVINKAIHTGGYSAAKTDFKNLIINDNFSISLSTKVDTGSIKLIKSYSIYNPILNFDEIIYKYNAKVQIKYDMIVGNKSNSYYYFQETEINSPIRLIYYPKIEMMNSNAE